MEMVDLEMEMDILGLVLDRDCNSSKVGKGSLDPFVGTYGQPLQLDHLACLQWWHGSTVPNNSGMNYPPSSNVASWKLILVGGLEHEFSGTCVIFPHIYIYIYFGNNHPNWRTHIFQRGRSTTKQNYFDDGAPEVVDPQGAGGCIPPHVSFLASESRHFYTFKRVRKLDVWHFHWLVFFGPGVETMIKEALRFIPNSSECQVDEESYLIAARFWPNYGANKSWIAC